MMARSRFLLPLSHRRSKASLGGRGWIEAPRSGVRDGRGGQRGTLASVFAAPPPLPSALRAATLSHQRRFAAPGERGSMSAQP